MLEMLKKKRRAHIVCVGPVKKQNKIKSRKMVYEMLQNILTRAVPFKPELCLLNIMPTIQGIHVILHMKRN